MNAMKICGACERERPEGAYSREQRGHRQSIRRCEECVAAGNQLVLMKRGRERPEEDICSICQLILPVGMTGSALMPCCIKRLCDGCILAARRRGIKNCPFCRAATPEESEILAMVRNRAAVDDPAAICVLGFHYQLGRYGSEKNVRKAIELCEKAAGLGDK